MIALKKKLLKCECEACVGGRLTDLQNAEMSRQANALLSAVLAGVPEGMDVETHRDRWAANTLQKALGKSLNGMIRELVEEGWGSKEIYITILGDLLTGGVNSLAPEFQRRWPKWTPPRLIVLDPAILPGLIEAIGDGWDDGNEMVIKH